MGLRRPHILVPIRPVADVLDRVVGIPKTAVAADCRIVECPRNAGRVRLVADRLIVPANLLVGGADHPLMTDGADGIARAAVATPRAARKIHRRLAGLAGDDVLMRRSEEHTSELQSPV